MIIRILDKWTITKIKAGQVISNYKDIVKELVENSIDAKPNNILIHLNFDNREIKVIDDGIGMNEKDLELSVFPHATSKFTSLDSISYLGFRGEGLYVINECSSLTIISKEKNKNGYKLTTNFKNELIISHEAANDGTEVIVKDIFSKTPGKIKFLSPRKDFINSIILIQNLSLAYPSIKFHVYKNNKYHLYLDGFNYEELIFQIFKVENCRQIKIKKESFAINMYLNNNLKDNKGQTLFFINQRVVEDFGILNTIKILLQQTTGEGNIQFLLFFIEIDARFVDFNLVPDKSQVRVSILNEIKEALIEELQVSHVVKGHVLRECPQFLETHNLKYWFAYKNKYIIAYYNDNIYMIDQHAISERLMLQTMENINYNSQILLQAISLDLTEEEVHLLESKTLQLKKLKFKHELIGNYLIIEEIPDFMSCNEVSKVIREFIHENNFHIFLHKLGDISCKNSLKAGAKITEEEVKQFIYHLNTQSNCHFCNHGRNTCVILNEQSLDKLFGRK
jgi:DNA mismatch repair protein MutL